MNDREKWDARYRDAVVGEAAAVLRENLNLLPTKGKALDLAAGLGANARLLAEHGLETHAWDVSPVAMSKISPPIISEARDVIANPPEPESFDVIVVSRFLDRDLCPAIEKALRPGGVLFYQTFTVDLIGGPRNRDFLLEREELPRLFSGLEKLVYREGDGEAFFVGRSPRPSE